MCHKCVTICQIKNRIPMCTLDSPNKPTYEIWAKKYQTVWPGSEHGEMHKYIKPTISILGPLQVFGTVKMIDKVKLINYSRLCLIKTLLFQANCPN